MIIRAVDHENNGFKDAIIACKLHSVIPAGGAVLFYQVTLIICKYWEDIILRCSGVIE